MSWYGRDRCDSESESGMGLNNSMSGCSTRRLVKSNCNTEEVEPGKFVRKCEKTEQILKDCIGRPTEVVQSNKEYTEDDVTNEVLNGSPSIGGSSEHEPFSFPGLRSDIESLERSIFGGLSRFFDVADQMSNSFFSVFDNSNTHDDGSFLGSSIRQGIPIEDHSLVDAFGRLSDQPELENADLSGLAREV